MTDEYESGDPYDVTWTAFHTRRLMETLDLVNSFARSGDRILDVGCGRGHITDYIRSLNPDCQVLGLDRSRVAIRYAGEHYPSTEFICSADMPVVLGEFDIVVMNNVIEHVTDPVTLMRSVPLRSGGHIIVSTPSRFRFSNILRLLRRRGLVKMSDNHVLEYTAGQVRELMEWAGYAVDSPELWPTLRQTMFFTGERK